MGISGLYLYFIALGSHGDQYLGIGVVNEDKGYLALNIYGPDLEKIKEVYRIEEELVLEGKKGVFRFLQVPVADKTSFASGGHKIYLTWGQDNTLKVFDRSGKKTKTITPKTQKVKITEKHKAAIKEYYKND
mgnify:CR=1 FL=1